MYFLKSGVRSFFGVLLLLCIHFAQSCGSCTGKKDYKFLPTRTTLDEAFFGCSLFYPGSAPAEFLTGVDYLTMLAKLSGSIKDKAWTAGFRDNAGDKFHWKHADGSTTPFSYTRWAFDAEPAHDVIGCVVVAPTGDGLAWQVENCSTLSFAICELCLPN